LSEHWPHAAASEGWELAFLLVQRGAASPSLPVAAAPAAAAQAGSARGLDWLVFLVADIQAGFGPFVAIYLTSQQWTQLDIGLVLTTGGLVALAAQLPGGALVDAVRSARLVAGVAVTAICLSALALALWPSFEAVTASRVVHAVASCVLGPAIAALSLRLAGHAALGARLGRNARFASIGNGVAAAALGACGYFLSVQSLFFLTAALIAPALIAIRHIRIDDAKGCRGQPLLRAATTSPARVLLDPRLLVFSACILLFQLANAAMLPLMASTLTRHSSEWAAGVIGICIVLPQVIVAACAPRVGRLADSWGRRPLLLLCFAALAARGMLFALTDDPLLVVAVQALDGICAAVLGVLMPLIVADLTRGTGRFNLGLGVVGSAGGVGAALSTTAAGYGIDHLGTLITFSGLALVGICGLLVVWLLLSETRAASQLEA
jgi:MFS family permease